MKSAREVAERGGDGLAAALLARDVAEGAAEALAEARAVAAVTAPTAQLRDQRQQEVRRLWARWCDLHVCLLEVLWMAF